MTPSERSGRGRAPEEPGRGAGGERQRRPKRPPRDGARQPRPERRTAERVQKILAQAGLGSRRACEDLIRAGQVTINGRVATLGDRADPGHDSIKVAGKRIRPPERHRYVLLNKPRGFVTTVRDPEGRPTVLDLVPERLRRGLRPVGRLDYDTEGLLLLTDDGELSQRVAHPRHGCMKTYEVKVKGVPDEPSLDRLRRGIPLDGRRTAPSEIRPRPGGRRRRPGDRAPSSRAARRGPPSGRRAERGRGSARLSRDDGRGVPAGDRPGVERPTGSAGNSWWVVRLAEGRTRQIRDMFQRIGHPVQKLRRIAIGPVRDPRLPVGAVRELTEDEVRRLRESST
ncbi:MAG TPA: pseudouridine synthase [Thermoanaerobaculia bacterium]|nr:pseudouridine synthase [Thermoanaerobaculia bacterium]